MNTHEPRKRSQVSCIGMPPPKTWDDYEQGCIGTYRGGHHEPMEAAAFIHGMQTVFNLLRAEFPPAEAIERTNERSCPECGGAGYTHDMDGIPVTCQTCEPPSDEAPVACPQCEELRKLLADVFFTDAQPNDEYYLELKQRWKELK